VSRFSESEVRRLHGSCFVVNSKAPLMGVISTADFLLKCALRHSQKQAAACEGHAVTDIGSG